MQERIDSRQLLALLVISRITISLLGNPLLTDPMTGKDAWLIQLVGSPFAVLLSLGPTLLLLRRAPGTEMPVLLERYLGRWVSRLLLLWQAFFMLLILGIDLREVGDFLVLTFLPPAATLIPIMLVTGLGAWAALLGIEVMGRFVQVTFPLLATVIVMMLILVAGEVEWLSFMPLDMQVVGILPAIRQVIIAAGRWQEVVWLGLAVPHLPGLPRITRTVAYAAAWLSLLWGILSLITTGLLGPLQVDLFYPYLTMTRLVKVPGLMERMDALIVLIWLFCCTARIGIMLWASSRLVGAIMRVRDRPLILPLAGIALGLTYSIAESVERLRDLTRPSVLTPMALLTILLPPLLALPLSYIRGRETAKEESPL